jgi:hypothetical protein
MNGVMAVGLPCDAEAVLDSRIDSSDARVPDVSGLVIPLIQRKLRDRLGPADGEQDQANLCRILGEHREVDSAPDERRPERQRMSANNFELFVDKVDKGRR